MIPQVPDEAGQDRLVGIRFANFWALRIKPIVVKISIILESVSCSPVRHHLAPSTERGDDSFHYLQTLPNSPCNRYLSTPWCQHFRASHRLRLVATGLSKWMNSRTCPF